MNIKHRHIYRKSNGLKILVKTCRLFSGSTRI